MIVLVGCLRRLASDENMPTMFAGWDACGAGPPTRMRTHARTHVPVLLGLLGLSGSPEPRNSRVKVRYY